MEKLSAQDQMKLLTTVGSKYVPYHSARPELTMIRPSEWRLKDHPKASAADIPLPETEHLRHGRPEEAYIARGEKHYNQMIDRLGAHGWKLPAQGRVLDFGCASGRVTRWFLDFARSGGEVWGVDLDAAFIFWCQKMMSPPFNFAVNTTQPHLPFEDRHFDLIFALSIFTHTDDLADAWLLELRRILAPGGKMWLTFNDTHSIKILERDLQRLDDWKEYDTHVKSKGIHYDNYQVVSVANAPHARVYYNRKFLIEKLSHWFDVLEVVDEGLAYQTAYVLERKS